jgi:predicted nuclease with TOPRIM domain
MSEKRGGYMQKRKRITKDTIKTLQDYLVDYIEEWSSINKSKKFRCFNSFAHRRSDADPSAAIVPNSSNTYWTCFSCGCRGDIFKAVMHREGIRNFLLQAEFLGRKYGVELNYEEEDCSKVLKPSVYTRNVQRYFYQDEKGNTIYKIIRKDYFEEGIRKKDFSMFSKTDSGWDPGLKGVKRYLYKLPLVLKAIENKQVIFLVEGEKCANQILDLGLIGTTTSGGARSWKAHSGEYVPYLKGAMVVVIPDNDEAGRQYAEDVIKDLTGTVGSVRKLELPNLPEKGDIVDWVASGGTKERLLELISSVEKQGPVFEKDFCYYAAGKEYDIKLSNFVINPKSRITGESESLFDVEFITEDGVRLHRVLKSEDFNDVISFRKAVGGFELSYVGRAEELQHIKVLISKKSYSTRVGAAYTGFHKVKDCWYFVSEQGTVKENHEIAEEIVLLEDCEELGTDILKAEEISREELLTIAPALFSFNTMSITSTILGYAASLFLKGKLREAGIKHNHLIIEGQSGSGKSSTLEAVIAPLLSIRGGALNASECSNFALNRAASSSNFLPVIIDEYKPYAMGKHRVDLISNVMRNSYDGHVVMKGVATLKKNREFNARASVILSGEVGMQETANIERSLKVVFAAANHNEERRNSMRLLKQNSKLLNKLGRSLLKGGLVMSEKKLKELYDSIYESLSGKDLANERVRNSITNCMLGIALLKGVFDELQVDFQEASGVSMSDIIKSIKHTVITDLLDNGNSSKGIIEDSLETMNRMAVNRLLDREYDYDSVVDSDGDYVLRLNYGAFYDRFVKFCKDYNVSHEVLPLASFKKQLSKLGYCKCFNKPTSFKDRYDGREKYKTFRAAMLEVEGLMKKNVDVEYMLDREG